MVICVTLNVLCTAVTVYTVCVCVHMCADVWYCNWHSDVAFGEGGW